MRYTATITNNTYCLKHLVGVWYIHTVCHQFYKAFLELLLEVCVGVFVVHSNHLALYTLREELAKRGRALITDSLGKGDLFCRTSQDNEAVVKKRWAFETLKDEVQLKVAFQLKDLMRRRNLFKWEL